MYQEAGKNITCRRIQAMFLFLLFLDTFRIQGKDLQIGIIVWFAQACGQ